MIDKEELEKFLKIVKSNKSVFACILFGSQLKNPKPNSDIDICIFKKKGTQTSDFLEILENKPKNYDLVFYDKLNDIIKFRVFSESKILYTENEMEYQRFKKKYLHKFRDIYPYYKQNMERMMANV